MISEDEEANSIELSPNITAELNGKGELIGIEILQASSFVRDSIMEGVQAKVLNLVAAEDAEVPPRASDPESNHSSAIDHSLLQISLAEYTALTNRITSWITLQFFVWPILLAYFAIAAQVWNAHLLPAAVLNWGGVLVAEVTVIHWYHAAAEMYGNANYLETVLRPCVQRLVPRQEFWGWERFRHGSEGRWPTWNELWPVPALMAGVLMAVWHTHPAIFASWNLGAVADVLAFTCTALLMVGIIRKMLDLVQSRRHFSATPPSQDGDPITQLIHPSRSV